MWRSLRICCILSGLCRIGARFWILTAKTCPVGESLAFHTFPKPPWPMTSSISKSLIVGIGAVELGVKGLSLAVSGEPSQT